MFLKVIYSRKTIWFAELCSLSMALFSLLKLLKGDYMNILYGIIIGIVADKIILPILDNLNDLIGLWFEESKNAQKHENSYITTLAQEIKNDSAELIPCKYTKKVPTV